MQETLEEAPTAAMKPRDRNQGKRSAHENRPKYNRDHLRYPSDLTDDEWAYVEPLIPPAKPGGGKPAPTWVQS
jgi:hypothetical protein